MKPIREQNNVELRDTVQELWDLLHQPTHQPPRIAPLPPPGESRTPTGWSYNPSKKKYRFIDDSGETRFYDPEDVPESVKKALDPSPTDSQESPPAA